MTDKLEEYISKKQLRFILEKIKEKIEDIEIKAYIDGILLSIEDDI